MKIQLLIILVCLCMFLYIFFFMQQQNKLYKRLDKEGLYDTAVIVREFIGAKSKLYYEYVFFVNGKKCNGFIQYSPSQGSIAIGDSCLVKYLSEDPENVNELFQRNDYTLIKIK